MADPQTSGQPSQEADGATLRSPKTLRSEPPRRGIGGIPDLQPQEPVDPVRKDQHNAWSKRIQQLEHFRP